MATKTFRVGRFEVSIRRHGGFFFLPSRRRERLDRRNQIMFAQDFMISVAPPHRLYEDDSSVLVYEIVGDRSVVENAKTYVASLIREEGRYGRREAIGECIRHIAERMAWRGVVHFDVTDLGGGGRVKRRLRECPSHAVFSLFNRVVQLGCEMQRGKLTIHVGSLRKSEVLSVAIPASLGGPRSYRRFLRNLDRFDVLGPKFVLSGAENARSEGVPWQLGYWRRASAYRAHAARRWGWNGRDASARFCTEYFAVYRHVRMHYASSLVREEIIRTLEQHLAKKDLRVSIVCRHPGSEAIGNVLDKMRLGTISLTQAVTQTRLS